MICPIKNIECERENCPCWLKLEDWEGCVFEFTLKAVKEEVTEAARLLDKFLGLKKLKK